MKKENNFLTIVVYFTINIYIIYKVYDEKEKEITLLYGTWIT